MPMILTLLLVAILSYFVAAFVAWAWPVLIILAAAPVILLLIAAAVY